jgi:predicted XRE-type DNA-binding protein
MVGTMNNLIELRDSIRDYMKTHPQSQVKIAAELGVGQSWVSKFVRGGIGAPRLERLVLLAEWVDRDRTSRSAINSP